MSRSGGMTVEIANSLSEAGLGVSTAVSIGGDAIILGHIAERGKLKLKKVKKS